MICNLEQSATIMLCYDSYYLTLSKNNATVRSGEYKIATRAISVICTEGIRIQILNPKSMGGYYDGDPKYHPKYCQCKKCKELNQTFNYVSGCLVLLLFFASILALIGKC